MSVLAALNFCYQASSCFGEVADAAPHEAFPPLVLLVVGASWPLASPNTNENANVSAWPFIHSSLFQYLRARIVLPSPFVVKDALPHFNRLKCKSSGRCSAPSLPDGTVWFYGWLLSRVIRTEENRRAIHRSALEDSCNGTAWKSMLAAAEILYRCPLTSLSCSLDHRTVMHSGCPMLRLALVR